MNIMILGVGVIGTTYGYIFQKSGCTVSTLFAKANVQQHPQKIILFIDRTAIS